MYENDNRIVLTLDAGGTNFVFGAMRSGVEIVTPVILPANADALTSCLENLVKGFEQLLTLLPYPPVAISFAFPGPADYANGIIGDLPNFPSFRGGVALGPFLKEKFGLPVFINNDGNLFAYGEALAGFLPAVNKQLHAAGSIKQYKNLLGITLGTGFGGGVVIDGTLLCGDNGTGGDVWCLRNKKYPQYIAEEGVSIRAIKRVYAEQSGDKADYTPKQIFDIAEGTSAGDMQAARHAFAELGEMAGDAIASAITLVDGVIVIGGGVSGASKYILPALIEELSGRTGMMSGAEFNRLQMQVFDLDNAAEFNAFAKGEAVKIKIPTTNTEINYDPCKRIGVGISKHGASRSIAMGAYVFALKQLD